MRSPLIRTKYEIIYENIDKATSWLSDHGLRINPTRIGEYKRVFKEFLEKYNSANFPDAEKKKFFGTYINLVYEVQEFVYIYQGLSLLRDSDFYEKLKIFVKGPAHYSNENPNSSSNVARNIAFELLIAAKLASSGLTIDFGTNADLSINHEKYKIFVECKRPQYKHQINSNIKGAFKQLKNRYKTYNGSKDVHGFVALSVSKVINPNLDILVTPNTTMMHSYVEKLLDEFHNEHKKKYLNPSDNRSIGMIVYFSTPVSVEEENIIAHSHLIDFTNCCDTKSDKIEIVRKIAKIVENSGLKNQK